MRVFRVDGRVDDPLLRVEIERGYLAELHDALLESEAIGDAERFYAEGSRAKHGEEML